MHCVLRERGVVFMFLKRLVIRKPDSIIRDISFKAGLNLIVDSTNEKDLHDTGNGVGKTTVLKLIDYCLGSSGKNIYTSDDSGNPINREVKDYLIDNQIQVSLTITDSFEKAIPLEYVIERNFLPRQRALRRINGIDYKDIEFDSALKSIFFPDCIGKKPSFRQLVAHNIRYEDLAITKVINYLNSYTSNEEYQTLYLYLFGCPQFNADQVQEMTTKIKQEELFRKKICANQSKEGYLSILAAINSDIKEMETRRREMNMNPSIMEDFDKLNNVRLQINSLASKLNLLRIKQELAKSTICSIEKERIDYDSIALRDLYKEANELLVGLTHSFDELVSFHNEMIEKKVTFMNEQVAEIDNQIKQVVSDIDGLKRYEKQLIKNVEHLDVFETVELLSNQLSVLYQKKGDISAKIDQIDEVDNIIKNLKDRYYDSISDVFSESFKKNLQKNIDDFNKHFKKISKLLYNEEYLLKVEVEEKDGGQKKNYKFISFNPAYSTGKKQGEILAFDLAYNAFASEKGFYHFSFLLNDKKELMSDNQLIVLFRYLKSNSDNQVVLAILKDKIPESVLDDDLICLTLCNDDKLFRF